MLFCFYEDSTKSLSTQFIDEHMASLYLDKITLKHKPHEQKHVM